MGHHDSRRKALTLTLGISVAAVAVAAFAALQSDRGESRVGRLDDLRAVEDDDRVEADLVVPEVDSAARQSAISDDSRVTASAAPDGPITSARGVIVSARTFPEGAVEEVHAWAVIEEDSHTEGVGSVTAEHIEGTCGGGEWIVRGLHAGDWRFIVYARSGERRAYGCSKTVRVSPGVENGPFMIVLVEYIIEGRVTDSGGRPIPGLPISFEHLTGGPNPHDPTVWRYDIVPHPLQQVVTGQSQGTADVFGPESVSQKAKKGAIWQRSLRGVSGLENATEYRGRGSVITTDESGTYRIHLEGPGRIELHVPAVRGREIGENTPHWIQQNSSALLTRAEPSVIHDLVLLRSATLVGRLTRADGGSVDGIDVLGRRESADETMTYTTSKDGEFKFAGLEPGLYDVCARAGGPTGRDFSVYGQLQLNEGEIVRIDEVLQPSSKIVGRVIDGEGRAVTDAHVIALGALDPDVIRQGTTDASGHFEIPGVYACTYDLVVEGWNVSPSVAVAVPFGPDTVPGGASDAGTVVVTPIVDDPGR